MWGGLLGASDLSTAGFRELVSNAMQEDQAEAGRRCEKADRSDRSSRRTDEGLTPQVGIGQANPYPNASPNPNPSPNPTPMLTQVEAD